MTPPCRPVRFLAIAASFLFLASGLGGCGRRGPLELPPETQALGNALKAEQRAAAPKPGIGPAPSDNPRVVIPGTLGNRPPDQYPFPLDPLL